MKRILLLILSSMSLLFGSISLDCKGSFFMNIEDIKFTHNDEKIIGIENHGLNQKVNIFDSKTCIPWKTLYGNNEDQHYGRFIKSAFLTEDATNLIVVGSRNRPLNCTQFVIEKSKEECGLLDHSLEVAVYDLKTMRRKAWRFGDDIISVIDDTAYLLYSSGLKAVDAKSLVTKNTLSTPVLFNEKVGEGFHPLECVDHVGKLNHFNKKYKGKNYSMSSPEPFGYGIRRVKNNYTSTIDNSHIIYAVDEFTHSQMINPKDQHVVSIEVLDTKTFQKASIWMTSPPKDTFLSTTGDKHLSVTTNNGLYVIDIPTLFAKTSKQWQDDQCKDMGKIYIFEDVAKPIFYTKEYSIVQSEYLPEKQLFLQIIDSNKGRFLVLFDPAQKKIVKHRSINDFSSGNDIQKPYALYIEGFSLSENQKRIILTTDSFNAKSTAVPKAQQFWVYSFTDIEDLFGELMPKIKTVDVEKLPQTKTVSYTEQSIGKYSLGSTGYRHVAFNTTGEFFVIITKADGIKVFKSDDGSLVGNLNRTGLTGKMTLTDNYLYVNNLKFDLRNLKEEPVEVLPKTETSALQRLPGERERFYAAPDGKISITELNDISNDVTSIPIGHMDSSHTSKFYYIKMSPSKKKFLTHGPSKYGEVHIFNTEPLQFERKLRLNRYFQAVDFIDDENFFIVLDNTVEVRSYATLNPKMKYKFASDIADAKIVNNILYVLMQKSLLAINIKNGKLLEEVDLTKMNIGNLTHLEISPNGKYAVVLENNIYSLMRLNQIGELAKDALPSLVPTVTGQSKALVTPMTKPAKNTKYAPSKLTEHSALPVTEPTKNTKNTPPVLSLHANKTDVTIGEDISFNLSFHDNGKIVAHKYHIGGRTFENPGEPRSSFVFKYDKPGKHTVSVSITDDGGLTTTKSININVSSGQASVFDELDREVEKLQ